MEGRKSSRGRRLSRCYQCSRLEEQLWATAYEQIWPVVRRSVIRFRGNEPPQVGQQADLHTTIARRA
jgi:hypothetical protein